MQESNFTKGEILPKLIRFALPLLLALLLQAMYGAADLLIVGRFGDASGVSAVATGSQIMQTITGIVTGLTMGVTVLLGQCIGAGNSRRAADTVGAAVCLFGAVAALVTMAMLLFVQPMVTLMHAPSEAFAQTVQYVAVCSGGTLFIVAYNAISGIFRGMGNSKLPLLFVAIACVVNIVGDLILVGIFHLDSLGAALATVLAQGVSVLLSLLIIRKKGFPFPFSRKNIGFHWEIIFSILRLGFPIALQDALTNVSFLILTAILNTMGLIVSAGVGVAEKVVIFIMLVPISFMSAISAFVAQNVGAGKLERAKKALFGGMMSSLAVGVGMFVLAFWYGDWLAGLFSVDMQVVAAAAEYLKAYAFDCIMVCFLFSFMGFFNGVGKTQFVLFQGVSAAFLVRIPFSYFMSRLPEAGMFVIGLATPLASFLSILLCAGYYFSGRWRRGIEEAIPASAAHSGAAQ